jgi:hypothetical protein
MTPSHTSVTFLFCLCLTPAFALASQSSNSGAQSDSSTEKPAPQALAPTSQDATQKTGKKPKKVWTNEEISTAGGPGSISVVGNADPNAKPFSREDHTKAVPTQARDKQIAAYRERLKQLHNELEITEKKISDLRNFKAENTSASGGINMNRRYSMTPVEDQVKHLEERKRQLESQIESAEDQARKNGVEPGELR